MQKHQSRRLTYLAMLGALTVVISSCGATDRDPAVATIGRDAITAKVLLTWMTALAPEHFVPDPPHYAVCARRLAALAFTEANGLAMREECKRQYQSLKGQALFVLITARWLIDEAANRGLSASKPEIATQMQKASLAGSREERELQSSARLAAIKIRQAVLDEQAATTPTQVLAYYQRHIRQFAHAERRAIAIVENLPSFAAAAHLRRKLRPGGHLAERSLQEVVTGVGHVSSNTKNAVALRAIGEARPGALSQPVKLNGLWAIFEVTRIMPSYTSPFAQVKRELTVHLAHKLQEAVIAQLANVWRAKWTARTDCAAGYVIEVCRQYKGTVRPYNPFGIY